MRLPEGPLHTRSAPGSAAQQLWDPIRRQWVAATPEEAVRQRLVVWLVGTHALPPARLAVERALQAHGRSKRFDVLAFDTQGHPLLLAECKRPSQPLTEAVLRQAALYNSVYQAPWLLLTNGGHTVFFSRAAGQYERVAQLPLLGS